MQQTSVKLRECEQEFTVQKWDGEAVKIKMMSKKKNVDRGLICEREVQRRTMKTGILSKYNYSARTQRE